MCSPKYSWDGTTREGHPGLLWQLTTKGTGRIDFASKRGVCLGPQTSFLAVLPSPHKYYYQPDDEPWEFRYVIWRGPALDAFREASCKRQVYVLGPSGLEDSSKKLQVLREMYQMGEPSPWQNVADAMELLIPVLRQAQRLDLLGTERSSYASEDITNSIRIDPSLAVDKEGWAEAEGMSRHQLYRRVKSQTGMCPKEIRNRRRLTEAIRYLKKPSLSVSDAATLSGFSSQNYFARFFKKQTGFSPTEWRRLFVNGA